MRKKNENIGLTSQEVSDLSLLARACAAKMPKAECEQIMSYFLSNEAIEIANALITGKTTNKSVKIFVCALHRWVDSLPSKHSRWKM